MTPYGQIVFDEEATRAWHQSSGAFDSVFCYLADEDGDLILTESGDQILMRIS